MTAIGREIVIDGDTYFVDEVWAHGYYATNAAGARRWFGA